MEKMVELVCETCQNKFLRRKTEAKRNEKLGRRTLCSLKCSGKATFHLTIKGKGPGTDHLKNIVRTDEYTPFRWHLNNAKSRGKDFDIDLPYLKELWEKQDGRCPYTGWKMKNLKSTCVSAALPKTPDRASLDRIDSTKGYIKGNVQFISMMANFAKAIWSESELVEFCEAVANHKQSQMTETLFVINPSPKLRK